jgi:hypothetical protein
MRLRQGSTYGHLPSILGGSAAILVVTLVVVFYVLVPYAVLGTDWLVTAIRQKRPQWSALGLLILSGLPSALLVGYSYYYFTYEPIYRAWAAQNLVRSPHPLHYLAGYALVGGLALLGGLGALRRRLWRLQLPLVWVAITPLLIYLPFGLQRRLIIGAQVPLGLLAALGLIQTIALPFGRSRWVERLIQQPRYSRRGMRTFLIAAILLATVPTNLLLIAGNSLHVAQRQPPIFHRQAEIEAMDWLRTHTAPKDTVLCAYETGNYVPARAGNRVLLGLGPETVAGERKRGEVQRFFDPTETDAWRKELLGRYQIAYVLVGPNERALGSFDADSVPYLHAVYPGSSALTENEYWIYQVRLSE